MTATVHPRRSWFQNEVDLWRRLWANGGRSVVVATSFFAASVALLVFAIIWSIVTQPTPFRPVSAVIPQHVTTPVVEAGGNLGVDATKCNHGFEEYATDTRSWLRDLDSNTVTIYAVTTGVVREVGCTTRHHDAAIPITTPPGRYRIEGVDMIYSTDGRVQRVAWHTEEFAVIAGG